MQGVASKGLSLRLACCDVREFLLHTFYLILKNVKRMMREAAAILRSARGRAQVQMQGAASKGLHLQQARCEV